MPSRLDTLRGSIDPILTGLAQGISNEAFVSEKLLPTIMVPKQTGKYPVFGQEHMRVHDAARALKDTHVKTMPVDDWTMNSFNLKEYALEIPIDHLEADAAADITDLEAYYMNAVMQSLLLTQEYDRVQLLSTAGSYASGNSSALTSTDCWDNAASKPLTQLKDAISTIRSKTAQYPNTLVLGMASYHLLQEHASLVEKMKYSQLAVVTEDLISAMLSTSNNKINVYVGAGLYEDPTSGLAVDLWGDVAVLAYVPQTAKANRNKYESSLGYTFTQAGYPAAAKVATEYGLTTKVAAFLMYEAKIAKNTAGYLFTNTKA